MKNLLMFALEFVVGYNFSVAQSLTIADLINANKPSTLAHLWAEKLLPSFPIKKELEAM